MGSAGKELTGGWNADCLVKMLFMMTEMALSLHEFCACKFIQPQSRVLMKETKLSMYTFIFLFPKQQSALSRHLEPAFYQDNLEMTPCAQEDARRTEQTLGHRS